MEMSSNVTSRPESGHHSADPQFQLRLENRLHELKADIAERPLVYAGIAFVGGFVANTYPARILLLVVARLVSWLAAPALLLVGIMKLTQLLSNSRPDEPTILQRS
jgi:hypothetical protein